MKSMLLVGAGGFIGSILRYKCGGLILHATVNEKFPYSTFIINIIGCLVIGILAGLAEHYEWFGPNARLFLFTGLLGGFTTFSAFGLDTIFLIRRHELATAALYAASSLIVGIAAVWVGIKLIVTLPRG